MRLDTMLAPLGFLELSPPQLIQLAADAGFASVGLRTLAATAGGVEYPMPVGSPLFQATQKAMADTGVAVEVIEVVVLASHTDVQAFLPALQSGSVLGAKRVLCNSDDTDLDAIARKFAELCDLAQPLGLDVEMEFMRFRRGVQTLQDAAYVVEKVNRLNGFIVVDALHLFRSGGTVEALQQVPAHRIASLQLCDAPLVSPSDADLPLEARGNRLPLGEGGLPLRELLQALPQNIPLAVEIPVGGARAERSPMERAQLLHTTTANYLRQ